MLRMCAFRESVAALALLALATPTAAQELPPVAPILDPAEIALPLIAGRAAAADRSPTRVASVMPTTWTSITSRYEPLWDAAGATGFGLARWGSYFAAAGIVPSIAPHPFLSPWGMLSYEGWLFDRYRAVWGAPPAAPERLDLAARWLQRGDRAMAEGAVEEAVRAYRRATHAAPEFALGWLALGAALAASAHDGEAARAFRLGLDRYPSWIAPALDWEALYTSPERLLAVQSAAAERATTGSEDSRFVAGVLLMFGGAPAAGRSLLSGSPNDPHAAMLLSRGPR